MSAALDGIRLRRWPPRCRVTTDTAVRRYVNNYKTLMNELDSRAKIIQAAIAIFAEKGRYGARMEEIATRAEINKAMLYYYFSTRENLYRETLYNVISTYLSRIFRQAATIFETSSDPVTSLKQIVAVYFEVFASDRTYTKLMIDAIASEPQELAQVIQTVKTNLHLEIPTKFIMFLEQGMAQQVFRRMDPKQLLINLISLTMFYFFGKPIISTMLDLQIDDEARFLQERQAAIIDLVLYGIIQNGRTTS